MFKADVSCIRAVPETGDVTKSIVIENVYHRDDTALKG